MIRPVLILSLLILAACGKSEVNGPTDPAAPVGGMVAVPDPAPPPGVGTIMPGAGPANFMGRWASDVSWCPNTTGERQPIEITTTRFEGYENSCAILGIDQIADGYEADLACRAEGATHGERIRMQGDGQTMRLTWLNRAGVAVALRRCTTLTSTRPDGPALSLSPP